MWPRLNAAKRGPARNHGASANACPHARPAAHARTLTPYAGSINVNRDAQTDRSRQTAIEPNRHQGAPGAVPGSCHRCI